jgi:catechol 2,3-dioxygenase-like lactoylglutathione lyase family enzyme
MSIRLGYVIVFVADMNQAVAFYRDTLGLPLKFQSPEWSEFATGETTLALHPASPRNPAGKAQLGFNVPDLQAFYREMTAKGLQFTQVPTPEAGSLLAQFVDAQGTEYSVSQQR